MVYIIALILLGLLLIFLEIFFIPGTTLFGIVGGVAVLVGVVLMYGYYGAKYGHVSLVTSLLSVLVAVGLGFKVINSNKLAMKAEITGKVNTPETAPFTPGLQGVAITDLRPNGKAVFNGLKTEVYSTGDFIPRDTPVEITKIDREKIFIQPLKT